MKKQAIVVIGNIASGKSTVAQWLVERTGYELICIDRVRVDLYQDGWHGLALEREAERVCMAMVQSGNYVYESTGTTLFYKRMLRESFAPYEVTGLHVKTAPAICENRFEERKQEHFQVAPPYGKMSVKMSIRKNHGEYRRMSFDKVVGNDGTLPELYEQLNAIPWTLIRK